jgi:hypothetical protein
LKDGKLVGRFTGRDVESFLQSHGRLGAEQVEVVVRMQERQLATQGVD